MGQNVWTTNDLNPWLIREDSQEYLGCVEARRLFMTSDADGEWECAHCGSWHNNTAIKCEQCGAPKVGRMATKKQHCGLDLQGWLPHALILTTLVPNDVIELRYTLCGRRDDPNNGQTVFRLTVYYITEMGAPRLSSLGYEVDDGIMFGVTVRGQLETCKLDDALYWE